MTMTPRRMDGAELRGYLGARGEWSGAPLRGEIDVVRDPRERLTPEREARRRQGAAGGEQPSAPRSGEVIPRLHPEHPMTARYN